MRNAAYTFMFLLLMPLAAAARPVSYADSWMPMTMNDGSMNSAWLSYSPTAREAIGVRADYMRADDIFLTTATYNRLVKRWNAPGSQANLYVLGGLGIARDEDDSNLAATLGTQADWESRRYFTSYENRIIEAGDVERSFMHKARIGVAPYVAEYGSVHSWLMLQVDHRPGMADSFEVTPLIRLFNAQLLGEFGVSNRGNILFNATYQF
jgi:hypothetical protein